MNAQYDENAKKLLSNKIILAHIVKGTIAEFKDSNPEDIVQLIEGEPYVSSVPVEPGQTNQVLKNKGSKIAGNNTEDNELEEGTIYFDIIFYMRMKNGISQIIVNIEAQKDGTPGYALMNRAIFYTSRMISSQKERDFIKSNYDDMINVYSIWICFNMNEDCLNHFHITDDALVGNYVWPGNRELFNFIMVGLDQCLDSKINNNTIESKLHYFLGILFSNNLSGKEKVKLLDEEINIQINDEIREELDIMCNLSYGIEERGIERGIERGMERGRLKTIADCLMNGTAHDAKRLLNATNEEIQKANEMFIQKSK